jgi:type II secretory pathway pseudopilin PulG
MNLEFRKQTNTAVRKLISLMRRGVSVSRGFAAACISKFPGGFAFVSKFKILNFKFAFTFIETLVAISILLIALVAPMSLAQDGIRGARLAQDQIVAFYLAQEGLEMVRNIRDQNKLDGGDILEDLGGCVVDPNVPSQAGCLMDSGDTNFGVTSCGSDCGPIGFYPYSGSGNTGVYGYGVAGYIDTKFSRDIKVWYRNPPNRNEAVVEVTIDWELLGTPQTYTIRNTLKDW